MGQENNTFTLPTPANQVLTDFVNSLSSIQPAFMDGVYLTGSMALNDFHSNKSDIDFLVLCKELPDSELAAQLKRIHQRLQKKIRKPDLSGSYLTTESIQTDDIENIRVLAYHQGAMRYGKLEMAPVLLRELKTNAITLYGEKAEFLPVDVRANALYKFLYENINSYWRKWIRQHTSFLNRSILLWIFPKLTEWSVLGVARQLYTLRTGKIVSKTEAGNYCLEHLPQQFHPIIKEAIKIRHDNRPFPLLGAYAINPSFKRRSATIACVNYIIAAFNEVYSEKPEN